MPPKVVYAAAAFFFGGAAVCEGEERSTQMRQRCRLAVALAALRGNGAG